MTRAERVLAALRVLQATASSENPWDRNNPALDADTVRRATALLLGRPLAWIDQ